MNIAIASRQRTRPVNRPLLKKIAADALAQLDVESADLGINLVAAREMTRLNESFLQHAGSTDVITFDYSEPLAANPRQLHGEIFVCVDQALLQAKQFRTDWQSEVARYVVHGILHLLGYDDLTPRKRARMKREENALVRRLARKFSLAEIGRRSRISA